MDIGGFVPFTLQDYPGVVAAMIFTQGCNFRCPFCHNKRLIPLQSHDHDKVNSKNGSFILDFLERRKGRLRGVVVSGGEPTIHDDLVQFLEAVKSLDYLVKLDTNGSHPERLQELIEKGLVDLVAMDIKAPWPKYKFLTGTDIDVTAIERSIRVLEASGIPHLFRTTFVPDLLTQHDLREIKSTLVPQGATYIIQPFRPPKET